MLCLIAVIQEKLFVTSSHHLYIILSLALSAPVVITILTALLITLHRRHWIGWRKRTLMINNSKTMLSPIPVMQSKQSTLAAESRAALEKELQPADMHWELNPDMYVFFCCMRYRLASRPNYVYRDIRRSKSLAASS